MQYTRKTWCDPVRSACTRETSLVVTELVISGLPTFQIICTLRLHTAYAWQSFLVNNLADFLEVQVKKNQDFIQLSVAFCYRNISYRISAFQIRLILHFHNHILSLTLCWHLTLVCDIINIMERASHVASINRVSMVVIGLPTFQIIPISPFFV